MKHTKLMRAGALALVFVMLIACVASAAPALEGETSHTTQTLATGAVYSEIRTPQSSKYQTQCVHMVEVDLSQRNLYLDVAYGNMNNIFSGSTVKNTMTKFAQSHPGRTVLAGVNGAPWNVPAMEGSSEGATGAYGWSFGFTYANGEIYTTGDSEGDWAVGISEDYVPMFGVPRVEISLTQGAKSTVAEYVNRMPRSDRIVIYTDRARGASNTNYAANDAYELLVDFGADYTLRHGTSITGTITAKYGPTDSTNPPAISANQMILTARGTAIADLEQFTVGQSITVDVSMYDQVGDSARWQKAQTIAGGFFPLILNGVCWDHNFTELYPATVVGYNRDGKFVMLTVDGRNKNGNCKGLYGSNIHKYLMEDLGLYNAMLLDGGGSATMTLNQNGTYTTVNVPTDGSDRSVKNAWILSSGPQRREQGDTSLDMLTAGPKVDPLHITFPDKYSVNGAVWYQHNTDYSWENESLKLTATGEDVYVGFNYLTIAQEVSADEYKYATIVYKIPSTNVGSGVGTEMFFVANGESAAGGKNVTSALSSTKNKWVSITFNASSIASFTGRLSELRFDFFTQDYPGDSIYVHDIILTKTASEATNSTTGIATLIKGRLNAPDQTTFSFNMHGYGDQVPQQILQRGDKPVRPADPTAPGMIFLGWYTSSVSNTLYDFDAVPYKNTTVHAKWQADPEATDVTLSFDMCGHGTQIPSQTFLSGGAPTQPADPSASGWDFEGWFTSSTGTTPFNFSAAITSNTTAYARWVKSDVTLSFDMCGHGTQIEDQILNAGSVPVEPEAPSEFGWIFEGWYLSADGSTEFDFTTAMDEDATAYARWSRAGDVDGDGNLNAQDVLALMRYIVGYEDAGFDSTKADFNGDGKLNNKDVLMMMLSIVNGN